MPPVLWTTGSGQKKTHRITHASRGAAGLMKIVCNKRSILVNGLFDEFFDPKTAPKKAWQKRLYPKGIVIIIGILLIHDPLFNPRRLRS
jgi:hypothetical protein